MGKLNPKHLQSFEFSQIWDILFSEAQSLFRLFLWQVDFVLDKCRRCGTINMKNYSVSEAADVLGVDRRTLQRWVSQKKIPVATAGIVNGRLVKFWTETEMTKLKDYKKAHYAGKGFDRRTGKRAKQKKS